jgi:soluble lytic murein transglycosylase-like protein
MLEATDRYMGTPESVAEAIVRALTAGRPRARYRVGASAKALRLAEIALPEGARDRIAAALGGTN